MKEPHPFDIRVCLLSTLTILRALLFTLPQDAGSNCARLKCESVGDIEYEVSVEITCESTTDTVHHQYWKYRSGANQIAAITPGHRSVAPTST
jgi:hypothetical protein